MIKHLEEALYAINRAINPDPSYRSDFQQKMVDVRDSIWTLILTLDPTRKD